VKRGPTLLQLDEQQQQTINKRRLVSNFGNNKTPSSYVQQTLTPITSLRGYVSSSGIHSHDFYTTFAVTFVIFGHFGHSFFLLFTYVIVIPSSLQSLC